MVSKSITIRDVAEEAGVSVATVSRALNHNYPVSEKLRLRINEAVVKLDYHPNSIARTMKTNNTYALGFLVSDISNPFFTTILKGIEDVVLPCGYNVISGSTEGEKEREYAYINLLAEKQVDGLIINVTGENNEYIAKLSQKLPIVLSNRSISSPDFIGDFVGSDDQGGLYNLTTHLLSLGHRRIGFINGPLKVSTGQDRFAGFCAAMKDYGLETVDDRFPYVCHSRGFQRQHGLDSARVLMEKNPPPTAIISANNVLTLGALNYFHLNDIRVPEDVSVVSFGDIENKDLLYVRPTVSSFSLTTIGNKLGELVLDRIRSGNQVHNREIRYVANLVPGDSTRPI